MGRLAGLFPGERVAVGGAFGQGHGIRCNADARRVAGLLAFGRS